LIALIFGSDHEQSTGQPEEWRDGGGGAADKGDGTHDIESRWVSQPPVSAGDCDHGDSITSRFDSPLVVAVHGHGVHPAHFTIRTEDDMNRNVG
jgi:hypothetical protein